jgi:tetratricopeptide (TPR) repeat protein
VTVRKRIDIKFVACVLGGLVALGVGVHFLHAFQVNRSQALLLRQAERAESREDPAKADYRQAARYLQRYLGYRPDDTDALARLGAALDEVAKQTNAEKDRAAAYKVLDRVVLQDPARSAVRRRAAELALHFGDAAHARNLLEPLARQNPDDGHLERLLGICEFAAGNHVAAAAHLGKSVALAPDNLEGYEKLAALYRLHLKRPQDADRVVDEMVQKNPQSPRALLYRARYYRDFYGQDKAAAARIRDDLAAAEKLGARDADALVLGAALARDRGDLNEARRLLQRGVAADPRGVDLYLNLVAVEVQGGDKAAAQEVLRRGLKALPDEWRLLAARADLALRSGDLADARAAVDRLDKVGRVVGPARAARDLFAAQILMQQANWGKAVALLEGLRLKRGPTDASAHDLEMLLGRCYERLGNPDRALVAYRRAAELKPLTSPARFGVGAVLYGLGRLDEAVASYREAVRFKDAPPRLRLALARALIARAARLPEKDRTWAEAKVELDRAARDLPGDPEVVVLRAEVLLREEAGRPERARAALVQARDANPDQVEPWLALADLAGYDRPAEALQVLDDAARRPALRDRVELRLARLRHAAGLPEKEAHAALAREEPAVRQAAGEDRQRLLAALGDAYFRIGAKRDAKSHWGELARIQPDNLPLHLALLDLALEQGADDAEIDKALQHIRSMEGGAGGPFWHLGEAARLVRQAARKDPPAGSRDDLGRARRHLNEAAKLRPSWSRAPALLAEIDELEGHKEEALRNGRLAVRLGDRRPDVLRRYMRRLAEARPVAEDRQLVGQLADQQEQALLAAGLGKAAAGVLFAPGGPGRALALARKAVPADSQDARDHLWLGQLVAAAGPRGAGPGWKDEAERAFTRARDLAPKDPATWLSLCNFLRETDRKPQADAVLAESQKALGEAEAATVQALAREAAGDKAGAEKYYLAAAQARPAAAAWLQNLASFYLRTGQNAQAEPYLQQLLTGDDQDAGGRQAWARRWLARAYAARGNYRDFKKALAALDDNKKSSGETAEDRRARAAVLAKRAEHRKEAIALLKQLHAEQPLAEEDRWLLVQLHDADDDWGQAQVVLLGLLNGPGWKNPTYASFYIDRLLRRKENPAQAERWLDQLEQAEPHTFRTKALRARALAARGRGDAAAALLREYAAAHVGDLAQVAMAMETAGKETSHKASQDVCFRQAEEMYRDLLKRSDKAEDHLRYAAFLGRRGRVRDALDECERARGQGLPEEAAASAVGILRAGDPGQKNFPASCARVEGWLRAGVEQGKSPPAFLALLAEFHDVRGDFAQAIACNAEALRHSPDNVVVLNNLAWLLALKEHQRQGDEALRLIDRAVAVAGPLPPLMDTRGTVLLELGKARLAVSDLEQAVALRPTPGSYFRLGRALLAEKRDRAAEAAFRQARRGGLRDDSLLHPLERDGYRELRDRFRGALGGG